MAIKDILENEKRNTVDDFFKIHFYMDGGWWRAYELSAFLCNHIPCNLQDNERLKVTKKHLKEYGEYVFVGLQMQSFSKYLPSIDIDTSLEDIQDKHLIFDVKDVYMELYSHDEIGKLFKEWKEKFKIKDKKDKTSIKNTNDVSDIITDNKRRTIFGILQQVISYPLDDKSPNENTIFIKQLKKDLLEIII